MMLGVSIKNLLSINLLFPFKFLNRSGGRLLFAAWLLFAYTIFSGALRKWVFGPGLAGNAIFFIQLLAPFIFFLFNSFSRAAKGFRIPVFFLIFLAYLIIAAFNPKNHTLYHGLFGLVIHMGFWVALVSFYQNRASFELENLVGFFVMILVVEVALAYVQYSLPAEHILNIKSNGMAVDATVGDAVRVSGTFSYIGGFQVMITFYGFLIWFLIILDFPFIVIALVFALSVFAALMSGSRGSMILFLFISAFAFLQSGFLFRRFINVALTCVILTIFLYFFGNKVSVVFDQAYNNFSERVEWGLEAGETEDRFEEPFKDVLNFKGKYPIYGIGLGSTYQGANIIFGESFYAKEFGGYEGELGRIILEGGFILFFLRIILLLVFLRYSYIPASGKAIVVIFFLACVVVFNTYQTIFLLFGIMLVERAYFIKYNKLKRT